MSERLTSDDPKGVSDLIAYRAVLCRRRIADRLRVEQTSAEHALQTDDPAAGTAVNIDIDIDIDSMFDDFLVEF